VTSAPTTIETTGQAAVSIPRPSLVARLLTIFSGTVGVVIKYVLLALANALGIWAFVGLAANGNWIAAATSGLATVAIDVVFLVRRSGLVPLKFLIPGTIMLVFFQIFPIVYNAGIAFTNWSTGHNLTKEEAIFAIQEASLVPPIDGRTFVMTPAKQGGQLVLLLVGENGKPYAGTESGLAPLTPESVTIENGAITAADGYQIVSGDELAGIDQQLTDLKVPVDEDTFIGAEGFSSAVELTPILRYDAKADTFTNVETGVVYSDNGAGSYAAPSGETIDQGWRISVGLDNFKEIFTDPLIRKPFVSVFIWTVLYAGFSVFLTFAFGLFLAIVLNKDGLRLRGLQRSLLIIPYAIPAFLSVLVWQGLLNTDFGLVNRTLGTDIPWLTDPTWAKLSCLLVNFWLGFPYFFLVSLGALQAIPDELTEAARVDGAGARQVFRKVTFPLLLVAVAPLLIASFAFNFNNFNNIYFLTRGGPYSEDQVVAGSTDILISYTYKVAFGAAAGTDYGLAAAISIVIFLMIATISAVSFSRTKALENLA
jgi:arabinogalactan oligomer / maltooligosaccharide transport system permease protein